MKLVIALVLLFAPVVVLADTIPPPDLKLVSPGKGARTPLRFAPKKGTKRTLVMTRQESKARGLKGKLGPAEASPAIKTTIEVEVTDVTADGDIHYQFVYTKAEIVESKANKPELVKTLSTAITAFVGVKGKAIVSSRGVTKQLDVEAPANATPDARSAIEAARGIVGQIVEPLPEDAVGLGAKWQTSSTVKAGEMTAETTVIHELVERTATTARVKLTLTMHGKGSGEGNLTTDTTATGETSLDLASVIPSQAKLDVRTEVGLDADGKRLAQVGTTKMTITSK